MSDDIARRLADPTRLLAGEDPSTTYVADAEHWLAVYSELIEFKSALLEEAARRLKTMIPAARGEVTDTDERLLHAELSRLLARQRFWNERLLLLRARAV